jgi:hypothetical protein
LRARRHQLCLRAPPNQTAVLATSSRPPGFCAAVVSALFLLSSPIDAQTRDPQQAALDDFVAARMLNTKCPAWQIDLAEARTRFAQLNLQPADWQEGGRHSRFFDERLSYYGSLLSRMSEMNACAAAEQAFGPDGRVRRGWMKRQ